MDVLAKDKTDNFKFEYSGNSFCVSRLVPTDFSKILNLFAIIKDDSEAKNFHPHAFNQEQAYIVTNYTGIDYYLGFFENDEIIGYGLLRGWDAGFNIPSLGIYIRPDSRGKGLSIKFMKALHEIAQKMHAPLIRLKVYPENISALNLYKKMGYVFQNQEDGQFVGHLMLHK